MLGPLTALLGVIVQRIGLLVAAGEERDAETLRLRHQVLVLQRQVPQPRFTDTDRTVLAVLSERSTSSASTPSPSSAVCAVHH